MADQTLNRFLSHLVEPLRLFHPTQIESGVEAFIDFLFHSIQHRIKPYVPFCACSTLPR